MNYHFDSLDSEMNTIPTNRTSGIEKCLKVTLGLTPNVSVGSGF